MVKLAIIGASSFQNPLIVRANERGIETHVFAWEAGDVGEKTAAVFHPISIIERDVILEECRRIGIDGIASIGSDLANIAVAYVADALGLTANSVACVAKSTDKHLMRQAFEAAHDPSPTSRLVRPGDELDADALAYPVIVKPVDRSGSRGIAKVTRPADLAPAIDAARAEGFGDGVLIEQFVGGREFSVEYLSWKGEHRFLALTEKFTTGAPHFIERGHLQPARVTPDEEERIRSVVEHALTTLGVEYGASHSEVKMEADGRVFIIEIGSRMGGDCIGSDLVRLSTGYDFVDAVIDVALGIEPPTPTEPPVARRHAAIRFVFSDEDRAALARLKANDPDLLRYVSPLDSDHHAITDSASRYGYFIFAGDPLARLAPYLPEV